MEEIIYLHRKIAPELISLIEDRYNILRHLEHTAPIGRRSLSALIGMSERILRGHVDYLKSAGIVNFSVNGMSITEEGFHVLEILTDYIHQLHGLAYLETKLEKGLDLAKVVVISGDSETNAAACTEMGRAAAALVVSELKPGNILAVSGGSTMAKVAQGITKKVEDITVVPARGGLGELVEFQANTIASVMASKLGGKYHLLHIPDGLNEDAMDVIVAKDAQVRHISKLIHKADVLVHGVGEADKMAANRGMEKEHIQQMIDQGAVGEVLGHYFNIEGKVIYDTNSVGLHLNDLAGIGKIIAVAAGKNKAGAIVAAAKAIGKKNILVTDEVTARNIQEIINILS